MVKRAKLATNVVARMTAVALLLLGAPWAAVAPAFAQEVRLTRLVDDRTLLPDGSPALQQLADFALDPSGNLAFISAGRVLAIIDGEIHVVGEASGYDHLSRVEIEGDRVFWSKDNDHGGGGILRWEAGASAVLVGEESIVPGTSCTFWGGEDGLGPWRLAEGSRVLFWGVAEEGECDDLRAVYLWNEGVIEALDRRRDEGSFLWCDFEDLEGDRILRTCFGPPDPPHHLGLYLFEADGSYQKIVAQGDPVPGRSMSFRGSLSAKLREGKIAFIASDDGPVFDSQGVYAWDGASLSLVLDREAPLPGGWLAWRADDHRFDGRRVAVQVYDWRRFESFLYVTELSASDGKVVDLRAVGGRTTRWWISGEFAGDWLPLSVGFDDGAGGVYAARMDGSILRVLGPGDVLDGRTVGSAWLGRSVGSTLAVGVEFSEGQAIYAAALPPAQVAIDVRPHRRSNRIRPSSRRLVPVALLGAEEFVVASVDAASLAFGPSGAPPWRMRVERRDVNRDGFEDLFARFRPRETGIARGDEEACLSGETTEGVAFEGCDAVRTAPSRSR